MTRLKKLLVSILMLISLSSSGGCALEEGLRAGLVDGTSSAFSAFIQAPVTILIERLFSGGE
ncbi:MAG TPA: hypothetical protein PKG54_10930 [Phycisphaerae bacterium]|jgi:hypothetical protein|nr:hypothetical protein [Phycisphaerae bacterium]HOB75030.1 hypothetical protein [Phycisphaerae bacterium]HOJ54835.1 hypothetical protein [Phycisphaerae bacterium]HOL26887.1 hypothetical protein [Phycisphaerae bacterium]HPP20842.1 hypothetical protein [Phycisphaerae bacterium]